MNNNVIRSDDPKAIEKLTEKLESCQKQQEFMKTVNSYYRKNGTVHGCPGVSDLQANKLDDKVIFRGYQNKESINELLCDSSIYVMTSHTESFGLVLIEAMSAGVPCLAYTSAQGANEIISNGVDGYLIKDRNEDEMIEKISELINDSKLRNKLGLNAKEKAKEFSKEKIVKIWENILK